MKINKIKGIRYIGAAILVLCSGFFTASFGAVVYGVASTKHNLGSSGIGDWRATSTNETCIFCHFPHNSVAGKPFLWNRELSTVFPISPTSFDLYSSATLTSAALGAVISDVSKLCMSCHDGVTALNSMANPTTKPSGGGIAKHLGDEYCLDCSLGVWGPNIGEGDPFDAASMAIYPGTNLRNDHPISFSYSDAQTEDSTGLQPISNPKAEGLVFWGPNSDQIECVTCHDPHINSIPKFLRRSNGSSNLCFACHIK